MPELPEVEVMRRKAESHVIGATLDDIREEDPRISVHLPNKWKDNLLGKPCTQTARIGKYLFFQFNGSWLHLHFGMTGSLVFQPKDQPIPEYTRLILLWSNGIAMYFTDPRTFGKMDLISAVSAFATAKKLGVDLLDAGSKEAEKMFANKKMSLKAILLKQRIVAGIGNWLADEALYRAKLHPASEGRSLSPEQRNNLLKTAQDIAIEAIAADTHYGDFPANFFVHNRNENAFCPCDTQSQIEKLTLGGRTTYFCPSCQLRL